jgi:hypothetical protein
MDTGAKRLTLFVKVDNDIALGGERHPGDLSLIHPRHCPQLMAGLTKTFPKEDRFKLCPAGFWSGIIGKGNLSFEEQIALKVKGQGASRLGADVNCE